MTRRRVYFWFFAGWVALTFTLTSVPNLKLDIHIPHFDKLAHFGFYAVMAFWCALWRRESGTAARGAVAYAVLFIAAAGAVDEFHQFFIPGRTMEFTDWLADGIGGLVGAGTAVFLAILVPSLLTE